MCFRGEADPKAYRLERGAEGKHSVRQRLRHLMATFERIISHVCQAVRRSSPYLGARHGVRTNGGELRLRAWRTVRNSSPECGHQEPEFLLADFNMGWEACERAMKIHRDVMLEYNTKGTSCLPSQLAIPPDTGGTSSSNNLPVAPKRRRRRR